MSSKELQIIEIDLNASNRIKITEGWQDAFGDNIKQIVRNMFSPSSSDLPVKIKGKEQQVSDFVKTLSKEKKYIQTAARYGSDDPRTYRDKFELQQKIKKFERSTGLKWPFK
jgi:hypothetical protein